MGWQSAITTYFVIRTLSSLIPSMRGSWYAPLPIGLHEIAADNGQIDASLAPLFPRIKKGFHINPVAITPRTAQRIVKAAREAAGVGSYVIHDYRSRVVTLMEKTAGLDAARQYANHQSSATTTNYIRASDTAIEAAILASEREAIQHPALS